MPRFSQLTRSHPVSVTFSYEGEEVTVRFDRNRVTQNWARTTSERIAAGDTQGAAEALFGILIDWDVVDDNDQPLPVSAEILGDLPIAAIALLDEAIGEATVPASEEGNVSLDISPAQPSASIKPQESPQNGPQPSPSLQPSASQPTR